MENPGHFSVEINNHMANPKIGPSHPDFSKAKPFRTDRRATHILEFYADLKPIAARLGVPMMITYPFVLVVREAQSNDIVDFTTAEKTVYGTAAFCAFDKNGNHYNYGAWPVDARQSEFVERATRMAVEGLKLSESLQVTEASPRKKWFGIF